MLNEINKKKIDGITMKIYLLYIIF